MVNSLFARCKSMVRRPVRLEDWFAVAMLGSILFSPELHAAKWDVSKSVSLNEVYTDNVRLANSGKESDFITQVTPSISVNGKGARASVNFSGSLRYDMGGRNSGSITPHLRGKANTELVRDHFFVDATASITQNAIDPYGDIAVDNINKTGNVTTSYQFSVSPYYKIRIKDVGDLNVRYRYTNTSHSEGPASNSGKSQLSADFNVDSKSSKFTWGVRTDASSSSNSGSSNSNLSSTNVMWGYQFNRRWQINGSLGRDWNDYRSTRSSVSGFRWTLNTNWTPNPRTFLKIGYGGRYFGSTPTLDFTYKSRRSSIKLGYSRIVTDANSQLDALAIDPVTGQVFPVALLVNDIYIDERFTGSYVLQGRRTTLTLSGTQSKQIYENSPQNSELTKLGLRLDRTISGKVSANVGVNWYQQDRSANTSAQTWQGHLGLTVKLGRKTSMNVGYSYNKRDDDVPANSYEENRANIGLSMQL